MDIGYALLGGGVGRRDTALLTWGEAEIDTISTQIVRSRIGDTNAIGACVAEAVKMHCAFGQVTCYDAVNLVQPHADFDSGTYRHKARLYCNCAQSGCNELNISWTEKLSPVTHYCDVSTN